MGREGPTVGFGNRALEALLERNDRRIGIAGVEELDRERQGSVTAANTRGAAPQEGDMSLAAEGSHSAPSS